MLPGVMVFLTLKPVIDLTDSISPGRAPLNLSDPTHFVPRVYTDKGPGSIAEGPSCVMWSDHGRCIKGPT